MIVALILLAFASSLILTGAMRRYALHADLLDHPNVRSSHSTPTPRGGGIAIVFSSMAAALVAWWLAPTADRTVAILVGTSLVVAFVGFLDDHSGVPARWRFSAHAAAAAAALWAMHGIPSVPVFGHSLDLQWFGLLLAVVYLTWMVNLYNFMDGIDGIASIEAITVLLGGTLCWWLASATPLWFIPVVFAAAVAGFLFWNYPPARIFMGDSGSGFIGMVLGLLSLWTAQEHTQVFWCWFILLGCFMVDATTTLVRRVRRGDKFHEAHRSHAYQFASRRFGSHQRVSLSIGIINLVWLMPIALLVALGRLDGVVGTIVGYVPLVTLAFRLKAGDRSGQQSLA